MYGVCEEEINIMSKTTCQSTGQRWLQIYFNIQNHKMHVIELNDEIEYTPMHDLRMKKC